MATKIEAPEIQISKERPTILVSYKCSNPKCFNLISRCQPRKEIPNIITCPVCYGQAYRITNFIKDMSSAK